MSPTIVSKKTYVTVFLSLMVLLGLTIGAAYIDLGAFNLAVAITIAVIKAILVISIFMHVRYGKRLTWVFAGAGFFWLAFLLVLAMTDYMTRF